MKHISLLKVLIIALIASSFISCEEADDPNNKPPTPEPTGNLQIFVRQDQAAGTYIGGATVFLYKSVADRDAGVVYKTAKTPNDNITTVGAFFNDLIFQKYYFKATYNGSGKDYEGLGESFCPVNNTTSYHIICTEK